MEPGRYIDDFSEDQLREYASEHVLYEIEQFVKGAQAIDAARAELFPMNFAIEVFALHVRNLLDFFSPRNARKTDACARHFCSTWKAPELNANLTDARWMADKQIAHLTTGRTADIVLKSWAVEPIVYSLLPIIEQFAKEAELVSDEFRQRVRETIAEVPPRRDWTELPPGPDLAQT